MAKKKSSTIDGILSEANTYIGTPYRFGGMTRSGIDCSAFVLSVYGSATGINLPRISSAQAQEGERVEREELEKGGFTIFPNKRKQNFTCGYRSRNYTRRRNQIYPCIHI